MVPAGDCTAWEFHVRRTHDIGGGAPVRENTFASFLLGLATNASLSPKPFVTRLNKHVAVSYFQDDWRVTSNLTLNLGCATNTSSRPCSAASTETLLLTARCPDFGIGSIFHDVPGQRMPADIPLRSVYPDRRNWGGASCSTCFRVRPIS